MTSYVTRAGKKKKRKKSVNAHGLFWATEKIFDFSRIWGFHKNYMYYGV